MFLEPRPSYRPILHEELRQLQSFGRLPCEWKRAFRAVGDLRYDLGIPNVATDIIAVPHGRITNFASFPWFLTPLFDPADSRWVYPSALHDYMYATQMFSSKLMCDAIFDMAMAQDGTPAAYRELFFLGLRYGGHKAWNASAS